MSHYEEPQESTPSQLVAAIEAGDPGLITSRLLALALQGSDPEWLIGQSIELSGHSAPEVRRASVIALGHIARVQGAIDRQVVLPHLQGLKGDPELAGAAADALEDIEMFARP